MPKCRNLIFLCCIFPFLSACQSLSPTEKKISQMQDSPSIDVSSIDENVRTLTEAVERSSRFISESLDSGTSLAIISITSADFFESEYALEELTFHLVRTQKFRIVDRHNLDVIKAEQQFQLSGDVDDDTAVSIGRFIGAAFVITGSIISRESSDYLRIRVLDVQTGQIKTMSSVSYGGN